MKLDKIELELRNMIYLIFVFVEKPIWYFINKQDEEHYLSLKGNVCPKASFFLYFSSKQLTQVIISICLEYDQKN